MTVPKTLSMRELRQNLAAVVDDVSGGETVFAGSHRKPEVVLMPVSLFQELTATQQRALDVATTSMIVEGMPPTADEILAARELAAGRIDFDEYRRRLGV